MEMEDYPRFSSKWNSVIEAKAGKKLSDRAMMTVFKVMSCYSFDDIDMALDKFMMNPDEGMYHLQPPSIVKIIEGNSESAAMIAWTEVDKVIRSVGVGDDLVLADRISMRVIEDLGGLIRTQDLSDKDLPFFGKEFKILYQRYRISGCNRYPEKLLGTSNIQREAHGLPLLPARFIDFKNRGSEQVKLPDMSKPRYKQIEKNKMEGKTPKQVMDELKKLVSAT